MSVTFVLYREDKPHLVQFTGPLEAVVEAIEAQPDQDGLAVYASESGVPRSLNQDEAAAFAAKRKATAGVVTAAAPATSAT